MNTKALKKGSILSETSFYVVKEVTNQNIVVTDEHQNEVTIGNDYVNSVLQSADYYESTESKTMTDLAEIFINSPREAMSVTFITQAKSKTKKQYESEIQDAINSVQSATLSQAPALIRALVENPISKDIPGSVRVMKGRHYGSKDDLGRISFIDMEQPIDKSLSYDSRSRKVDPRTIQELIVNKVKYTLKK